MSQPDNYELSATYIDGLGRAVQRLGYLDSALATMTEQQRNAWLRPARQPWWDARFAEDLAAVVCKLFNDRALEQVGYEVICEAIGPLIKPQLDAALAGGAGPEALFERLGDFAKAAVRPIEVRWAFAPPAGGTLELVYPRRLQRETQVLWRGAIQYAFELSRRPGAIVLEEQTEPGHLVYQLRWSSP